jgi:hypothetical protein
LKNKFNENKENLIIHEIGHTLGLSDVFKDVEYGHPDNPVPNTKLTRSNYMDYYIQRKMFSGDKYKLLSTI